MGRAGPLEYVQGLLNYVACVNGLAAPVQLPPCPLLLRLHLGGMFVGI